MALIFAWARGLLLVNDIPWHCIWYVLDVLYFLEWYRHGQVPLLLGYKHHFERAFRSWFVRVRRIAYLKQRLILEVSFGPHDSYSLSSSFRQDGCPYSHGLEMMAFNPFLYGAPQNDDKIPPSYIPTESSIWFIHLKELLA